MTTKLIIGLIIGALFGGAVGFFVCAWLSSLRRFGRTS